LLFVTDPPYTGRNEMFTPADMSKIRLYSF
jgi:hypothetical protein